MLIVISGKDPEKATVIEYVVDNLYGDGPKGLIARMVMSGKGLNDLDEIRSVLRKSFPNDVSGSRKSSLSAMVFDVKKNIDIFLSNKDINKIIKEENANA